VGLEHDLTAAALSGFGLDVRHQLRAEAAAAEMDGDEKVPHVAGRAPRPSIDAADHGSIRRAQENSEQLAVVDAGRFDVEPMQTVLKRSNVLRSRLFRSAMFAGGRPSFGENIYTVQST
jgi:hypothetical protein